MTIRRILAILLLGFLISPASVEFIMQDGFPTYINAKGKTVKKTTGKSAGKKKTAKAKTKASAKKKSTPRISVLYTDTTTGEWIHRGSRNIVIHRDSMGIVRAMSPFKAPATAGKPYAQILNAYADSLKKRGTKVYSLIAPTQGEFYMPEMITDNVSQDQVFRQVANYFSPDVTPIFVADNLRKHIDEEIYNRTDHHWAPLGAYYAAEELARQLGTEFIPLDQYCEEHVNNYVGSMYNFSGDPAVRNSPEVFVYFIPPGDYYAEFIDYKVVDNNTQSESPIHEAPIFRRFPDGSGSAYSTFLGGDRHTVRIVNKNGINNRKLLIVKDSFGNAMAPCLINSFDEVHVIDFRYFPHNLPDYMDDNGITDLVFVNCPSIGFSKNASSRFLKMLTHKEYNADEEFDEEENEEDEAEE